jgi:hypothetical protein
LKNERLFVYRCQGIIVIAACLKAYAASEQSSVIGIAAQLHRSIAPLKVIAAYCSIRAKLCYSHEWLLEASLNP